MDSPRWRRLLFRPRAGRLEDRITPTHGLPAVLPFGDAYTSGDERVELYRRVDQLAVRFDDLAAAGRLTAPDGPLSGLAIDAWADARTAVFAVPGPRRGHEPAAAVVLNRASAVGAEAGVAWAAPVFTTASADARLVATDEVVLALDDPADAAALFAGREFAAYRPVWGTADQFVATLAGPSGAAVLRAGDALAADPRVRWAAPNFRAAVTPASLNDPFLFNQWHLNNFGQLGGKPGADVNAFGAWKLASGKSVTIAVLDDGIQLGHPDLAANIFINAGEIAGNGTDDDGNGWIDDVSGYDFASGMADANPKTIDDNHGTAIAGVAAAVGDNNTGVAGLAYRAKILPVRLFGTNFDGTINLPAMSEVAAAIYYAAGRTKSGGGTWKAADVLNLSFTINAPSPVVSDAIGWATAQGRGGKGAVVAAAAGNEFGAPVAYPASLSAALPGVIAVGATNDFDTRAFYSNAGTELDLLAPSSGGSGGVFTTDREPPDGYDPLSEYAELFGANPAGTSTATALTSAAAALVLQRDGNLTASAVRALLRNTTALVGPFEYDKAGFNPEYGYGRLDAGAAVRGAGAVEIELLDGTRSVGHQADAVPLQAVIGQPVLRTLRVRNQGTLPLTLTPAALGPGPVSLQSNFGSTTLTVGQSTTLVLAFNPLQPGSTSQTLAFTTNDPDEANFSVAVNATALNPSISGIVYEDRDNDGQLSGADFFVPNQTVYVDANENGKFDSTPTTTPSVDVPVTINGNQLHVSKITVAGFSGPLVDVALKLSISHTYVSDVTAYLVNPAGQKVLLFGGVGGDGQNFTNTELSDSAGVSISDGSAPFTGNFRPTELLSQFVGGPANGTWQLQIEDTFPFADDGELLSWSLTLSTGELVAPAKFGSYTFFNLPAGTYPVRWRPQPGLNPAAEPIGGVNPITLTGPTDQMFAVNFGVLRADTIYGRVFEDANANGTSDFGEDGLANWTTFLDLNGDGVLTDTQGTFSATDVPVLIDGTAFPHASVISVSGQTGTVVDVNVTVNLSHPNLQELFAFLIGPDGRVATLFSGLSGANLTGTVFDDQAALSITDGTAPYTGKFRPMSDLASFNGANPNGDWSLQIFDFDDQANDGLLTGWSLSLTVREPTTVSDFTGVYTFTPSPGSYSIRRVLQPGFVATGPVGGAHAVTLAAGQSIAGRDFGQVRTHAVYGRFYNDFDQSGAPSPGEPGLLGFTAYADRNGNGKFDQQTFTFQAADTPLPIDDFVTTTSKIVIAGQTDRVLDVAVKLSIAHPRVGELSLQLTGPNGESVLLASSVGGIGKNFTDTVFTDSAALSIFQGTAPFTGSFRPLGSLSTFRGIDPNGTWTLDVTDFFPGSTGTLLNWSLDLTLAEPFGVSNLGGYYGIRDLKAGPQTIRAERPPNWVGTQPAGGQYALTLPAGGTITGKDFGQYFQPPPPPTAKVLVNGATDPQRSMVTSLVVQFSEPVSYLGPLSGVFQLQRTGPGSPQVVTPAFALGGSSVTITFTGGPLDGPLKSLADGRYSLAVNSSLVVGNGGPLDGNGDGTGGDDLVFNTHRLFGDGTGNAKVDFTDFLQFRGTFGLQPGSPNYLPQFDLDGINGVNFTDFLAFRTRFGTSLP